MAKHNLSFFSDFLVCQNSTADTIITKTISSVVDHESPTTSIISSAHDPPSRSSSMSMSISNVQVQQSESLSIVMQPSRSVSSLEIPPIDLYKKVGVSRSVSYLRRKHWETNTEESPHRHYIICFDFLKAKRSQHYGKFEVNFYIHRRNEF